MSKKNILKFNLTFPETPIKNISYKNFTDLWVKDESLNPTGTHKDRMAQSIVQLYKDYFNSYNRSIYPPSCSLITSGNAALAISTLFKKLNLPRLKVLLDESIEKKIINLLEETHCEVYITNIFNKPLKTKDILSLTNNLDGIDITSYTLLDFQNKFYTELVNDVLSLQPDTIIVPYGSGILFENFCSIIRKVHFTKKEYNLIGITTINKTSKANKLYSAYAPFDYNNERLHFMKRFGFIGKKSSIYHIDDNYFDEAMGIFLKHNISAEYSGIVGLAYIIENADLLTKEERYVIVNTGKGIIDVVDQVY